MRKEKEEKKQREAERKSTEQNRPSEESAQYQSEGTQDTPMEMNSQVNLVFKFLTMLYNYAPAVIMPQVFISDFLTLQPAVPIFQKRKKIKQVTLL